MTKKKQALRCALAGLLSAALLTGCSSDLNEMMASMLQPVKAGQTISADSKWINSDIDGAILEDTQVELKDDFHTAVNKEWLLETTLDSKHNNITRFSLTTDVLNQRKLAMIKELQGDSQIPAYETSVEIDAGLLEHDGELDQFDAMWISSLCDSTAKGKPDIELVDMTSRFRTIDDVMEVTTKPIIFDGDTGGLTEHFVYTVRSLERMGVSAVIIEDKTGLKKNSLFGTEVAQTQDSIENFSEKIAAGKKVQLTDDFMIIARIESLILEQGMEDALTRAFAFVKAGADGIMIHSRKKDPAEILEFCDKFRAQDKETPIVVVPSSFNTITEEELGAHGVNIVIYANQLTRSAFPAMEQTAKDILKYHRAKEVDDRLMPIKDIISLIETL